MKRILHRNEKEIIRVLFKKARPLTVNEIAVNSGMSWLTAQKYSKRCAKRGILKVPTKGKKEVYRINPALLKTLEERKCKETLE